MLTVTDESVVIADLEVRTMDGTPARARLGYHAEDPYAVAVIFAPDFGPAIGRSCSRDLFLLADVIRDEPQGLGHGRVTRTAGYVHVEFAPHLYDVGAGRSMPLIGFEFTADAVEIEEFIEATTRLLPIGYESAVYSAMFDALEEQARCTQ